VYDDEVDEEYEDLEVVVVDDLEEEELDDLPLNFLKPFYY